MAKKYYLAIFVLLIGLTCFFLCKEDVKHFSLDENTPTKLATYISPLIKELNKSDFSNNKKFKIYFANFFENHPIVKPKVDNDEIPILWLGSYAGLYFTPDDLKMFPYIFVTSDLLNSFLNKYISKLDYIPLGLFDNIKSTKGEKTLIGIIGDHPIIKMVLDKKNIPYKEYTIDDLKSIENDIPKFKACFVNETYFEKDSIDLHPIFYKLAYNKIPIATYWGWPKNIDTINIFNDAVSFYMYEDDASILIDEILNNDEKIEYRKNIAYKIYERYFSKKAIVNNIKQIIEGKSIHNSFFAHKSVNFDLGVSVGHIGSGDFWLAQDLGMYFNKHNYELYMTFFDSLKKYNVENNIVIRGFLPVKNKDLIGNKNFLYIAYPQFGEIDNKEDISSFDEYINNIVEESQKFNAVFVASKKINDALQHKGIKSFYIPQFTNSERFFPDFDKELETDVIFVGVNSFYRKAVHYLLEEGISVDIYGPNFKRGVAKKDHLDNRVLRKYYSSAKIVLNDTRDGMKEFGVISNRIFDASACGGLVISDYMKEIEDIYGDSIPMWKTKEELIYLVRYYLDPKNEDERKEKINKAREITLKNHTSAIMGEVIQQIIENTER